MIPGVNSLIMINGCEAFDNTGIDLGFYNLRERGEDEVFPWDFIDIGVTKKFLRTRMGSRHEGRSDTELPYAVFWTAV